MHLVNQYGHIVGRGVLRDTMAKIKYVPALAYRTKVVYHPTYLIAYGLLATKHDHRVHIALQSHAVINTLARLGQVDCPIDAQSIGLTIEDILKPLPPALGKDDDGYTLAVVLALQPSKHLFGVLQRELLEQAIG